MKDKDLLDKISIRTELQPGDIGRVIHMHGILYGAEYNYSIQFETYDAKGMIPKETAYGSVNTKIK
ncbi:MAG: hypothetical protein M3R47_01430 [Chloroflexota bacterium]|nr:hypothetical protein [Chloroflexota bacterium]